MKSRSRFVLVAAAALAAAAWAAMNWIARARDVRVIEAQIKSLRARGDPASLAELLGPRVPAEDNAFAQLVPIFLDMQREWHDLPENAFQWGRWSDAESWSDSHRAVMAAYLAAHRGRAREILRALQLPHYVAPATTDERFEFTGERADIEATELAALRS